MKKLINVLIVAAVGLFTLSCASQRLPNDLSGITCGTPTYEFLDNCMVKINLCVHVPANYFKKSATFAVLPSIEYFNGEQECLPEVCVQGTSVVDTNYPVVDWTVDQTVCYESIVPFHEGLTTSVLVNDGWICDCLSREEMQEPLCRFPIIVPIDPMPAAYKVFVATESDIRAALNGKIYFPVNGYTVTNAITNQPDITRMMASLKQLIQRDDFVITQIEILGNASPEGTQRINNPLAERRAKSTRQFFEKALKANGYNKALADNAWSVTSTSGLGFWNEFYTIIRQSDLENKESLGARFLRLSNDPQEAEKAIRQEIGTNKALKTIMLPSLRYGSIVVSFAPIDLSADEVIAIANNHPEYLTPHDIINSAESMHTEKAIDLYETSLERYPGAVELYVNLANAYISLEQFNKAEETLATASLVADDQKEKDMIAIQRACVQMRVANYPQAQELLNTVSDKSLSTYWQGILCIYQGENEKAINLLADTKDVNYAVAQLNLNDIKGSLTTLNNLGEEDAYVLYLKSVGYARLNQKDQARQFRDRAFEMDPSLARLDGKCK